MKFLNALLSALLLVSGCAGDIPLRREDIEQGSRSAVVGKSSNVALHFLSRPAPPEALMFLDSLRANEFTKDPAGYDLSSAIAREFSGRLKESSLRVTVVPFEEVYEASGE